MKYFLFFLILILSLVYNNNVIAQYNVGVSAGMTKSWENYGEVETPEDAELHIYGKYVTFRAYKGLNRNFQIGLEPSVTQKGARCEPGFFVFNSDTYLYLNYIDLPVIVKYDLSIFQEVISIQSKLGYGPSFLRKAFRGVLLSDGDQNIGDLELNEVPLSKPFSEKGEFARFEHSLFSGIAFGVNFGKNKIILEADYIYGLSNVNRLTTSKSRTIKWGLGYNYQF
jgi:hypothetical protein